MLNRREFEAAAIVTGVAAWGCAHAANVALPQGTLPGRNGGARVLVCYASRYGSTGGVAEAIARVFREQGDTVELRPLDAVTTVQGYDAIVLGSAVRFGSWLTPAVEFVTQHQAALSALPVAIFTVHMNARDDSEESRKVRASYLGQGAPHAQAAQRRLLCRRHQPGRPHRAGPDGGPLREIAHR